MRLLLDAQISQHRVARPLREDGGHDVLAVVEVAVLDGARDEDLLTLATDQKRILVTFDVGDFVPLLTRLATEGTSHAGCILISSKTIRQDQFSQILMGIRTALEKFPSQNEWINRVAWLSG